MRHKTVRGIFSGKNIGRRIAGAWNHRLKLANKGREYACTFGMCMVRCSSAADLARHDYVKHEPIREAARRAQAHAPNARPAEVC